jgi:hypothetical protein
VLGTVVDVGSDLYRLEGFVNSNVLQQQFCCSHPLSVNPMIIPKTLHIHCLNPLLKSV